MRLPKLAVFDVDGTLVDHRGECAGRTRDALVRLRRHDVIVAIATGRPLALAEYTLGVIGNVDWVVCGNGSSVLETASGDFVRNVFLPDEVVGPLIRGLRERLDGVGFAVELERSIVEEHGFGRRVPEPSPAPPVDDVLVALDRIQERVRRVIPFHDAYDDRLDELSTIVSSFVDERCQVRYSGLMLVDVSPAGDHKAVALQELVDHLEIGHDDVMVFGDAKNDLEMLRWAGTSVAMANADPSLHDVADHITGHIDDGGVALFLEPLLDGLDARRGR